MSTRNISPNVTLITLFLIAIDAYIFFALKKGLKDLKYKNLVKYSYIISVIFGYIGYYFLFNNFLNSPLEATFIKNIFIGFFFTFLVSKLVLIVILLAEDIYRFFHIIFLTILNLFRKPDHKATVPGRRKFIRQVGLSMAAIPFTSMFYGITKGKYNFKVKNLKLYFDNLPKAFDGFKLVQISDIHSGSFDSNEAIRDAVKMINQQNADVILFTGDLVNNDSREIIPFISDFKELSAKQGVYSVLGNHDYGDYKSWNSEEEKQENQQLIHDLQKQMNFNLLNNENVIFSKDDEKIGLFGVENWGHKPFPQRGDLDLALQGAEDIPFKILMSHDPTHWQKKVIPHQTHFDLTLSGHTHGMQFGVEIPGFKWSPVKYLYPQWAGVYQEAKQYLYVNRGFGFIGFPGRAGIWPEITVIELSSSVV
ncbi:MAG: metallophosphoesterase [Bacteroidota bacterium]